MIEELLKHRVFACIDDRALNIYKAATSSSVAEVRIFALGPRGTNIEQAARIWAKRKSLDTKATYHFCSTPKIALSSAKEVLDESILPLFVLCAVYFDLNKMYFSNLDDFFCLDHLYMPLDGMQLCGRVSSLKSLPRDATVAVHRSPMPLVEGIGLSIIEANSNAHAAELCRSFEVDACVTTETARQEHGLSSLHYFGHPRMLFTIGTTLHGSQIIQAL